LMLVSATSAVRERPVSGRLPNGHSSAHRRILREDAVTP
jgi:hypothetical protein